MRIQISQNLRAAWRLLRGMTIISAATQLSAVGLAQGIITFNSSAGMGGTYYYELGMRFQLIIPPGSSGRDDMAIGGPFPPGGPVPQSSTAYMAWFRQYNLYNYVSLNLTNGYSFGLTSVQLADPNSPSSSLVPISFIGYLAGGSSVTNTFTTPGGGANSLLNYTFTSAFSSGLLSVDILASRWAMDNLVFGNVVPEPGTIGLLIVGLLAVAARKIKSRR